MKSKSRLDRDRQKLFLPVSFKIFRRTLPHGSNSSKIRLFSILNENGMCFGDLPSKSCLPFDRSNTWLRDVAK